MLTADVEARRAYDALVRDFPDQAASRVVVAVRFPGAVALTEDRIGALYDLSRRVAALPHVRKVESLVDGGDPAMGKADYQRFLLHPPPQSARVVAIAEKMAASDHVVLVNAIADSAPDSEDTRELVRAIRAERRVGDGTLLVGGQTAEDVDATAYIRGRAPWAIAFVVVVTLVVLFALLGSLALPIKAVLMNVLSIAGSFGALVWIFQDGHLFVHAPRPLDPSVPVLLFCVLFGLSMDYEVLMLSRIKEAYQRGGDNTRAVAEGLEKTAGLITSAAAIMVAVFASFSFAHVVVIQAVGFGMALGVALDATLVRVLLVPATMRLLGHLNWWAPGPLVALRNGLLRPRNPPPASAPAPTPRPRRDTPGGSVPRERRGRNQLQRWSVTVTLSGPPFALARAMSCSASRSRSSCAARIPWISWSSTTLVRPSEQRSNTSPRRGLMVRVSTSILPSEPTERVRALAFPANRAKGFVPRVRGALPTVWSSVRRASQRSRKR